MLSFATTMTSDEMRSLNLPDFPVDNLHAVVQILVAYSAFSFVLTNILFTPIIRLLFS